MDGPMLIYTDDFLASTRCLTSEAVGAYALILMAIWSDRQKRLPNDDVRLARIANVSTRKWRLIKGDLSKFFYVEDEDLMSHHLDDWFLRQRKEDLRPAIPTSIKRSVFARDGERCVYCGETDGPFHLDHRTPWSRGGEHTAENLCVACADCNLKKGDMTETEWGTVQ